MLMFGVDILHEEYAMETLERLRLGLSKNLL